MTSSARGVGARLPRLLALVPYLLARPGIRIEDAAADFGVSAKQLRKDLELLWMCGLPGYGPGDLIDLSFEGDTVTVTYDAGMRRPLRLTGGEATALLVALRALAETPGVLDADAVRRAIAKIEAAAGQAQPAGVVVDAGLREARRTAETRRVVQEALNAQRAVRMQYYTASKDRMSERVVDPMRLLVVEGRSYLEAWCRRAEDGARCPSCWRRWASRACCCRSWRSPTCRSCGRRMRSPHSVPYSRSGCSSSCSHDGA